MSDPAGIRGRAVNFYQNLYRSELKSECCVDNVFLDSLPKVSEEANKGLEGVLTLEELSKAPGGPQEWMAARLTSIRLFGWK